MRIAVIDGHPDADRQHFCHALADCYEQGSQGAGHEVRRITLADMEIPFLRSAKEWQEGQPVADIKSAQEVIGWSEHLVIVYPLWLGDVPAYVKAFLEQTLRPGFALGSKIGLSSGLLKGKSARIIVTMGMPAFFYRYFFFAHSLRSLKRNILQFVGIGPVHETIIGMVESSAGYRAKQLEAVRKLGQLGR